MTPRPDNHKGHSCVQTHLTSSIYSDVKLHSLIWVHFDSLEGTGFLSHFQMLAKLAYRNFKTRGGGNSSSLWTSPVSKLYKSWSYNKLPILYIWWFSLDTILIQDWLKIAEPITTELFKWNFSLEFGSYNCGDPCLVRIAQCGSNCAILMDGLQRAQTNL